MSHIKFLRKELQRQLFISHIRHFLYSLVIAYCDIHIFYCKLKVKYYRFLALVTQWIE